MSTRSIILVKKTDNKGKTTVHRLYKHHDGYPTNTLPYIGQAINDSKGDIEAFVASCESQYRDGMIEETYHNETFDPEMLGYQSDLEWIYTVDLDAKYIKVFGGGYTGEPPQEAYQNGTVNPLKYVDCLIEEYQQAEKNAILEAIYNIKTLGYTINNKG